MSKIGSIHSLKIKPGSKKETTFMDILRKVEAKPELVLCRRGYLFWTAEDEYILSDELWRLIFEDLRKRGVI